MRNKIVVDGKERLADEPEYRRQCREKVRRIRADYAVLMAGAGGLKRLKLWWRMRQEIRRVRPSDAALWLSGL